ncbi:MAG: PAS domain S-box protein, partial [Bacteroidales bacterium]|nr:PAS domain S-box protein [Bacteroidales bacterium]
MNRFIMGDALCKSTINSIPFALSIIDSECNFLFLNKFFVQLFGFSIDEIPNMRSWFEKVFLEDDTAAAIEQDFIKRLRDMDLSKENQSFGRYKCKTKSDKTLDVNILVSPFENNFIIHFLDITDYKKDDSDLIQVKSLSEKVVDSFPGLFYLFEIESDTIVKLVQWNKNLEKFTGYSSKELNNKYLLDFFDTNEHAKILVAINKLIEKHEVLIEANLKLKNNKKIPYEFLGKYFGNNKKNYFFGFGNDISSRKISEQKILNSERRYKLLSDLSIEGILIHQNGIALDMNETFARIFGYKPFELIGQNVIELISTPEDREMIYNKVLDNYELPYEINAFKKNGEIIPIEIHGGNILHDGKKARAVSIKDISERKEKERELIEHQLFIQRITEQSPDIIYIYEVEKSANIYINKDLRKILGYSSQELPDSSTEIIQKLIHPDDVQQFDSAYNTIRSAGKDYVFEFTYRLLAKNGDWKWFAGKEKEFQRRNGIIITMIGTLQDISTQKAYEQALSESEEQLSTIFENAPMIMILLNSDRKILKANRNAEGTSGPSKSFSLNKLLGDALNCINSFQLEKGCGNSINCVNCELKKTISETFETKENRHKIEVKLNLLENNQPIERFLLVSTTLMKSMEPTTILLTLDDITERKRMEIDLKEAKEKAEESNKLKTSFLQNMSHEIRTPMNGIIGFSEMLNRQDLSDDRRSFYTNVIVNSSNQLLNIVNDILDISKIETGLVKANENKTNLNRLMSELFSFFKPQAWKKGINMYLNLPLENKEAHIMVDDLKLHQILNNLIANALKFTHQGYIRFGYAQESEDLTFYVEDSGIGIEKNYHEKIFEQFRQLELTSTRRYGGTGLGLSISKAYAKILNGKLWLESEEEVGSTFFLTIPYRKVKNDPVPDSSGMEIYIKPYISGNPTILIAEDEEINFLFLKEIIENLQITILRAKDGEEAIEMVKNNNISLVLLDIKMPKINGY